MCPLIAWMDLFSALKKELRIDTHGIRYLSLHNDDGILLCYYAMLSYTTYDIWSIWSIWMLRMAVEFPHIGAPPVRD